MSGVRVSSGESKLTTIKGGTRRNAVANPAFERASARRAITRESDECWKQRSSPDNGGDGQIQFTIRGNSKTPHEFEGKTFTVNLPKGYKDQDTRLDRFGMLNKPKAGNPMTIYFDDLQYDGKAENFAKDPGWVAVGNRADYEDREQGGAHDFGFSATSNFASGTAGELVA